MFNFLRMEYLFNRKPILIILAIFSAYFAYMCAQISSPRVFLVTSSIIIGLTMPFAILGREDKFKTASFICSLPGRRSDVILARYAAMWISILVGIVYSLALTSVLPFTRIAVPDILTLKFLLIFLLLVSMILGVILPFTLRFGFMGIIIFLVSSQLLGIVSLLLMMVLGRGPNPLRTMFHAVEKALRFLLFHKSTPGFLLILAAAVIALNTLSIFIARAAYARREL